MLQLAVVFFAQSGIVFWVFSVNGMLYVFSRERRDQAEDRLSCEGF